MFMVASQIHKNMFISRLSLKLNFGAVANTFLTKTDYRDYMSSQLKMEREVAPLKIQDDGEKVIKLQAESLRTFLETLIMKYLFFSKN